MKVLRAVLNRFSGWWRPRPAVVLLRIQPCALCLMPVEVPADFVEMFGDSKHFCCGKCAVAVEEARVIYVQLARWENLK